MLPALYASTLFVGATLLFLVQPLVGKLLLPLVGGTPGVWNTCMLFFQMVLLAGYLYAHRATTKLGVRRQAIVHLGVLIIVLVTIKLSAVFAGSPVPMFNQLVPADQDYPIFGVAALLATAVGIPFFVLSTTSPLLQRWFVATGHPSAHDPYFLYAASNAGSLLGLVAYPLLIEPNLTLATQRWWWATGVICYLVLVLFCSYTVIRRRSEMTEPKSSPNELLAPIMGNGSPYGRWRTFRWVVLAAVPSSLLLGAITHISTDLAPVPLLWVVPLALYLLSFILVFARWPLSLHHRIGRITPMLMIFVVLSLLTHAAEPLGLIAGLHFAAFFCICLVCHGELALDRPPAAGLTAFYYWMSFGGVVGGLFNALVAPMIFHRIGMVEYPLVLALAAMVRPNGSITRVSRPFTFLDGVLVAFLWCIAFALVLGVPIAFRSGKELAKADALEMQLIRAGLMFGIPSALAFALVLKPIRFSLALAGLFIAGSLDPGGLGETLHMERNFFGIVRVTRSADGRFIQLIHGTTIHGQERDDKTIPPRPLTYYHEQGPVGSLFSALPPERLKRVGVVGLGTGAMAAYARPGQDWTFFEIDPAVARIARDPIYFRFLSTCDADRCDIILGDARRQLLRIPDATFDLLVLDAFSSDSIPVHLLTREAIALFLQKLAPTGLLAMHISNNHLDLPPLVARLAADHSPPLSSCYCHDGAGDPESGKSPSQWVVLARKRDDFPVDLIKNNTRWGPLPTAPGPIWSDDFANLLGVWKRKDAED